MPKIRHELDVSNFAHEFTDMSATDSPAVVPLNGEKLFKVSVLNVQTPENYGLYTVHRQLQWVQVRIKKGVQ